MPRIKYRRGKYQHIRYRNPDDIIPETFRTVLQSELKEPLKSRIKKDYPHGTKFVIGISAKTGKWVIQAVLIKK